VVHAYGGTLFRLARQCEDNCEGGIEENSVVGVVGATGGVPFYFFFVVAFTHEFVWAAAEF